MRKDKTTSDDAALPAEQRRGIEKMILENAETGRLPCARAWAIAKSLKVPFLAVGRTADRLQIRISQCQLGCF
ncbi:MAG: hypothetical protein L3J03_04075 [Desulfobacterales bacterium]|nr:hypothetical protein [Desulfobacterales bacterium]